ncbi:MAG: hypothetical protein ACRD2Z_16995 [Thermoanaerobaculia bacterium]
MTSRLLSRRRWLLALLAVAAAPLLLTADHGLGRLLAGPRELDLAGAQWIWAPRVSSWSGPTAFLALRDLELAAAPASARLLVLADEEYALSVNGRTVGAGRYRPGAAMDAYDIGALLRQGNNRLVFELRSGRGVGGFLALLRAELPGREPVTLVTDGDWSISYRWRGELVHGFETPLPPLPEALVLSEPPFGRWGPRRANPPRTVFDDVLSRPRDWMRAWTVGAGGGRRRASIRQPVLGERILIDFGREETGFLVLGSVGPDPVPALVYVGSQPPRPETASPSAIWISLSGKRHWLDAEARRFRYVLILGARAVRTASVYPVREIAAEAWPPQPEPDRGVFGLAPARLRTPVEDKIWSQLQGLPGG